MGDVGWEVSSVKTKLRPAAADAAAEFQSLARQRRGVEEGREIHIRTYRYPKDRDERPYHTLRTTNITYPTDNTTMMTTMMKTTMLSMVIMCLFTASTLAFAPSTSITSSSSSRVAPATTIPQPFLLENGQFSPTSTQLQENKKDYDPSGYKSRNIDDGIGRGIYLQLVVFGLCAWLFTIPPEFRRAYFCAEGQDSATSECVTTDEWFQGISDYYKNGGGIQWDFSIDPRTKAANQQKLDEFLNNMKKEWIVVDENRWHIVITWKMESYTN